MRRRAFLATAGVASLAGCVSAVESYASADPDEEENSSESPAPSQSEPDHDLPEYNEPEIDDLFSDEEPETPDSRDSGPLPEVRELVRTDPRVVSIDHTPQSGYGEFSVTINNAGIEGDVLVELYWKDEDGERLSYAPAQENTYFFDAGERREISMTEEMPWNAERYEFEVTAATFGAVVKNTGEGGRVTVTLSTGIGEMQISNDERTVHIDENEGEQVVFDGTLSGFGDQWTIEAEPAD